VVSCGRGRSSATPAFSYASGAAARASFDQLRTRGFALCRGEAFSPYGDDQADVPNVNAASARRWAPASGRPGFTTADSHILLEPESAPPGYQRDYTFSAFVLAGSGIVEVHLFSARPLESSDRAAARRVADAMAGRFVG
jgi:hypothetical protein